MTIHAQSAHMHKGFPYGIDPSCSYCQQMPVGRMGCWRELMGTDLIDPREFREYCDMRAIDFIRMKLREREDAEIEERG